jgi:RND family efflux transporter MFP subunit
MTRSPLLGTLSLLAAFGPAARAQAPPSVPVAPPVRATVSRMTEQPGQLEPFETTPIHAKAAGFVAQVAVDIGDRIKAGQVLLEIAAPELEADVTQARARAEAARAGVRQSESAVVVAEARLKAAEARIAGARAAVAEAEAGVARREAELRRVEQLSREAAVTGSLLDESRSTRDAAVAARDAAGAAVLAVAADVESAKAGVAQAGSDLVAARAGVDVAAADQAHAEAMAAYRRVVAPYDGVVLRRQVDTGHLTRVGEGAAPLLVVARVDRITVAVDVPEAEAVRVEAGDPARVRLQALEGKVIEAPVTRTAGALDPASRTLRVEIDLPNADGSLRPGLYAYVGIAAEQHPNVLTIPAAAVLRDGDRAFCMVVRDGVARRVPIRLGLTEGDRVEVAAGLTGTEPVVQATPGALADGQRVTATRPAVPAGS